jgi:hypothetical protein
MISTRRQTASEASVPTILKGLGHARSAETRLTGSARVNLDELATGACSLVRDESQKLRPPCIVDRLGQHPAGQPLDVQIFHRNQAETVDDLARFLVNKIRSLIANLNIRPLKKSHCFASAVATLFAPCHFALAASQPGFGIPVVAGVLNLGAIRQNSETIQADVNPDLLRGCWQWLRIALDAEAGEPAAGFPLDGDCLDLSFERPVQFHIDMPRALYAQLSAGKQPATVAVGRKGNAVVPARRPKPGKTWLVSAFHSGKESLEGSIHPAQHILAAREVCQRQTAVGAHGFELISLVVIVNRLAANLPGLNALLERGVVKRAGFLQFAGEECGLCRRRIQPVFEGENQPPVCTKKAINTIRERPYSTTNKRPSANAESLFRCRLKATVPEA